MLIQIVSAQNCLFTLDTINCCKIFENFYFKMILKEGQHLNVGKNQTKQFI